MRRARALNGALVLAALLTVQLAGCGSNLAWGSRPTPTPIPIPLSGAQTNGTQRSYQAQRGPIVEYVTFAGKASLGVVEELFFARSGRLANVSVHDGDFIQAGTLIAEQEIAVLELERQTAQLALDIAKEQLADAQTSLTYDQRNAQLALEIAQLRLNEVAADDNAVAQRQVQQAEIALERIGEEISPILALNLQRAELTLAHAQRALEEAQILAPIDGEIRFIKLRDDGRAVSVSAYEPVAQLVDPNSLLIELNLTRAQLEPLREGLPVEILMPGGTESALPGTISVLPRPFGGGSGPLTKVSIGESANMLRLLEGSTVDVRIQLAEKSNALLIPVEALFGFSGQYYVRIQEGAVQRPVDVEIGIQNETHVEILAGLSEGQVVLGRE